MICKKSHRHLRRATEYVGGAVDPRGVACAYSRYTTNTTSSSDARVFIERAQDENLEGGGYWRADIEFGICLIACPTWTYNSLLSILTRKPDIRKIHLYSMGRIINIFYSGQLGTRNKVMIVMQGKVVDNIVIMDSHATDYAILHRRWIVQEVGYVEMIALAKKDGREMKFADVMAVGRSLIAVSKLGSMDTSRCGSSCDV
ncbi:hypothetical protein J3A83DRAFT_2532376 [Scleroderma citrinum]